MDPIPYPPLVEVAQHVSGTWLAKSFGHWTVGYKTIYTAVAALIVILGASIFGIYNHFGGSETLNKSVLFK